MNLLVCFYAVPVGARSIFIAFRNDDISVKSDPNFELRVLRIFKKYDIKPLYAVIPALGGRNFKKDMSIVQYLQEWEKEGLIEIAMHGYTHKFHFSKLDYDEQYDHIKTGKYILQDALDIPIEIFSPPWNAANRNTLLALQANSINYFSGFLGESSL